MSKANKRPMTLKSFTRDLRRGLGSAIIKLKTNPNREKYRDIVMRTCLKDIAYDTQVEGTKGYYLYAAILTLDNQEEFLNNIAEKFNKRLSWRLSEQLYDILCCFSKDGHEFADKTLEKKYNELKDRLPTMRNYSFTYCEREQFEKLMIRKMGNDFELFRQCVNDIGEMTLRRGGDDCLFYDWFLNTAEDKFGEEVHAYLGSKENENIAALHLYYTKSMTEKNNKMSLRVMTANDFLQSYRPKQNISKKLSVTIEQLIVKASELEVGEYPIPHRITPLSRQFASEATEKELEALANIALEESSDFIKACLLRTFSFVNFPFNVELLFPYALSDNEYLRAIVSESLSRFKDKRIHTLALQLLEDNQVENALKLLEYNFELEDEDLIRKHIKLSKQVTCGMVTSITKIYEQHKSTTCGDILLHFYRNIICTHCRYYIVKAMIENKVISSDLLEECKHDSYDETRKLALS